MAARLPFGFPGCVLDRVLERTTRRLISVCLLPDYRQTPAADELGFSHLPWDADAGLVADRWLLIRHRTLQCTGDRPTTLAELKGRRLHAPRLPAALRPGLAALAAESNASLAPSET